MSATKTHVKKGDNVEVIAGKYKGKTGEVLSVLVKKQQVVLDGVRIIKKTVPRSQENPEGGILDQNGPIHISNVKKVG